MAYLLDADVFIRAKNLHYGFDFFPGFWDRLVEANERGVLSASRKSETKSMLNRPDLPKVMLDSLVPHCFYSQCEWESGG